MKSQTFILSDAERAQNCIRFIHDSPHNGTLEVVVRDCQQSKTMQQLGALFGVWVKCVEETTGYSQDEIHAGWKRKFLIPIYRREPLNLAQETWLDSCEYLALIGAEKNDFDECNARLAKVSLSWATKEQMSEYMQEIENYYISSDGHDPLPVPDKYRKSYEQQKARLAA